MKMEKTNNLNRPKNRVIRDSTRAEFNLCARINRLLQLYIILNFTAVNKSETFSGRGTVIEVRKIMVNVNS